MKKTIAAAALVMASLTAPAMAGTLTVCLEGAPETFNPQLTSNGTTATVLDQIFDGLVAVEAGGSQITPALATSWTVSDDGKTYTFALRKGVKWQTTSDFTPTREFNADDVVFTFARMMDENHPYHAVNGGNYITFGTKLADALVSVEKVDDYTVAFTLKEPLAPFIGIMAHGSLTISSAEYADQLLAAGTPELLDRNPVGTGPFQLQAYQTDAVVRLLPFAQTWGAEQGVRENTPLVDGIIMTISPDASVRVQQALAGECQIAYFPNLADAPLIEQSDKLDLVTAKVASSGFLTFNFKMEKFQDIRVRQALAHAINMKPLIDSVFNGMGHLTGAIIPEAFWGHADLLPYEYDPEKAKQLLAEAGYPDGFETQLWAVPVSRPYMPNGRRAAEMIQADWAAIGVKAEIVTYEWAEYIQRARNFESEVGMFGGIYDFPDPSQIPNNYFTCDSAGKPSPSNIGSWCNPDFIATMAEAGVTTDQAKRAELYVKAQKILYDDYAGVMFGGADQLMAVNKSVRGFVPAIFGTSRMSGVTVEE
ncbi:peptide ABC transporter substrate-bindingprotein [Devosia sp. H5989]|nr:peptide ABC transporter substrate-bindingprotein [Devosia sp. H5989]